MSSRSSHRQSVILIDHLMLDIQHGFPDITVNEPVKGNNESEWDPNRPIERPRSRSTSVLHSKNPSSRVSHRQSIRDLDQLLVQLSLQSNVNPDTSLGPSSGSDRLNRRMSKLETLIQSTPSSSLPRLKGILRRPSEQVTSMDSHIPPSQSASSLSSMTQTRTSQYEQRLSARESTVQTRESVPQVALNVSTETQVYSLSLSCYATCQDVLDLLNSRLSKYGNEPYTHITTLDQGLVYQLTDPLVLFMDLFSLTATSKLELKAFKDQVMDVLEEYAPTDASTMYASGETVEMVTWRHELQGFGWMRGTVDQVVPSEQRLKVKTKQGHLHSVFHMDKVRRPLSGLCTVYASRVVSAGTRVEYGVTLPGGESVWAAGIVTGMTQNVYMIEKVTSEAPLSDTALVPSSPLSQHTERSLTWRLRHFVNTSSHPQGIPGETVLVRPEHIRVGWSVGLAEAITLNRIY